MAGFQKGKSGNPAGKPKGALNKRPLLTKLLEPHAEALVAKMLELALAGDPVALRLCIERLIPKADQKHVVATMPDLSDLETSQIIPALLKSLAGQEISVAEIKSLMDIFTVHDEVVQKEEKRYEKLEITTRDPIEAAKQYAEIMTRARA
ncbi:MAG: hypothetical protein CK424_00855 [Legionella sp.]|nr:MAG: hypothetical protein CK424_00855 [Legionella sp.]